MKCGCLIVISALLLAGCVESDNALLPELKGRWAPVRSAQVRAVLASNNSSVPAAVPSVKELCQSEYITFQKYRAGSDFLGRVVLYRKERDPTEREPVLLRNGDTGYLVKDAKREGDRIILIGQEPNHPLAGSGQTRLELVLRNGEISFNDIIDQRGRSVRYDRIKTEDPVRAQRAGIVSIGDMFRLVFDLKPCLA